MRRVANLRLLALKRDGINMIAIQNMAYMLWYTWRFIEENYLNYSALYRFIALCSALQMVYASIRERPVRLSSTFTPNRNSKWISKQCVLHVHVSSTRIVSNVPKSFRFNPKCWTTGCWRPERMPNTMWWGSIEYTLYSVFLLVFYSNLSCKELICFALLCFPLLSSHAAGPGPHNNHTYGMCVQIALKETA